MKPSDQIQSFTLQLIGWNPTSSASWADNVGCNDLLPLDSIHLIFQGIYQYQQGSNKRVKWWVGPILDTPCDRLRSKITILVMKKWGFEYWTFYQLKQCQEILDTIKKWSHNSWKINYPSSMAMIQLWLQPIHCVHWNLYLNG